MQINKTKFDELIEKYAKPKWENPDDEWHLRKGGGEIYIQDKVLEKASIYISPDTLKKEPRKNLINTLMACRNLLSHYESGFARNFIENTNEAELSKEFSNLLYSSDNLESRLEVFLKWAKVEKLDSRKNSGINAIVCSYFLAMSNPRIYPFCKPIVYNFIAEQLPYKEEKRKDQIQRIIHCQKLYTELLSILENQYGLIDGNLLDVHSLGYLFQVKSKEVEKKPDEHELVVNHPKNYWWLNANPKIWDFYDYKINQRQSYTTVNEHGNKRRIYSYFKQIQPGDLILCYISSPIKEVAGFCTVTKGLHQTDEGEVFEFEILKQFKNGLKWNDLKSVAGLENCEPMQNNQGSLFKLTSDEYENIIAMADDLNPIDDSSAVEIYDRKNELKELFLDNEEFNKIIDLLKYKKNIILQGPPGVGKTFMARHLAWAMMGVKDHSRIGMVQFHQSYSYEDFIQGFRPDENGGFILKNGVFYEFCKQAGRDKNNPYFFIIDEINRGNLSKIMGELMMLIEPDKRDDYALPLTYAQNNDDKFSVPSNIFLIGTMNTADRSLAMVDYALRRRFCFINLEPAYNSEKFSQYLNKKGVDEKLIKNIKDNMLYLNQKISDEKKDLGSGFCIGHSYFCNCDSTSDIDQSWYENIIEYEIAPLLKEYWFDNIDKAEEQVKQLLALNTL